MDYIILELHFGVPEHHIRSNTRNRCCNDLVGIFHETASILYPDIEFEIFFYPPEKGSYKDIVRIVKKNPGVASTVVITLGALVFQGLTYIDSHQDHLHNEKIQILDDTVKCIDFQQKLEDLKTKGYEVDNISEDKLKTVCGNLKLKKLKNDHWKTLEQDDMISQNEIILLDNQEKPISTTTVARVDFEKCIEAIPENEEYKKEDINGVIELISPVFKQKKRGKGTTWKGIYYGEDIENKGFDILQDGEEIQFYMQDNEFKKKITAGQVSFQAGDNLKVVFTVSGLMNTEVLLFQNRKIYVSLVEKFNEDLIEHKERLKQKNKLKSITSTGQLSFDELIP